MVIDPPVDYKIMWNWMAQPIKGDNRPYAKARAQIDKLLAKDPRQDGLLEEYTDQAYRNPHDPVAQFRRAYLAEQLAVQHFRTEQEGLDIMEGIDAPLRRLAPPYPYDYARLMFLEEQFPNPDIHAERLGEQLLRIQPNDYDVTFKVAGIYSEDMNPPRFDMALAMVPRLEQIDPRRPSVQRLIASIDFWTFVRTKNAAEADAAVAALNRYLAMSDRNDVFRAKIPGMIKMTEKMKQRFAAQAGTAANAAAPGVEPSGQKDGGPAL
jgi:hypothetical protein